MRLPFHRLSTAADLVFIQNGMLQPWLDERGLGDATQVRSARQRCSCTVQHRSEAACRQCLILSMDRE